MNLNKAWVKGRGGGSERVYLPETSSLHMQIGRWSPKAPNYWLQRNYALLGKHDGFFFASLNSLKNNLLCEYVLLFYGHRPLWVSRKPNKKSRRFQPFLHLLKAIDSTIGLITIWKNMFASQMFQTIKQTANNLKSNLYLSKNSSQQLFGRPGYLLIYYFIFDPPWYQCHPQLSILVIGG